MKLIVATFCALVLPVAAHADESKAWVCTYTQPDYHSEWRVGLVGGKLVERNGLGHLRVVPDAAVTDDLIIWNAGSTNGVEMRFFPKRGHLVHAFDDAKTTHTCVPLDPSEI